MADKSFLEKPSWEGFFEALQHHMGITGFGGILVGFLSAILVSRTMMMPYYVTRIFLGGVVLTIAVWLLTKLTKKGFDKPSSGVLPLLLVGYGVGALLYEYRGGVEWVWLKLLTIDSPPKVLLAALFLFGLIMGFFLVRNWSKNQEDFQKSVIAAGTGALLIPLLGKVAEEVNTFQAFVFYFLGFSISGAINLIAAALLTASYSNKKTISSRTVLSFLYGSDKAEAVDKQFLKNFEEDPIYARRLLVNTVIEYQKRVRREFAAKKEERRKKENLASPPNPHLNYYLLLSIECETELGSPPEGEETSPPAASEGPETQYRCVFRQITDENPINEDMFRIAVSVKWQDNLEYIGAPGAYRKKFSYFASVAGLALFVRQTIVMDRDKNKRFRTSDYPEGLWPAKIEQARGLDEIDFLSYIAIPVVSSLGQAEETSLGILHVDTKLFAVAVDDARHFERDQDIKDPAQLVYRANVKRSELTEFANNLYDSDDAGVKYLEEMRAVLVPILDLYLRCRQGST